MKRIPLLVLLLSGYLSSGSQQLINASFENWGDSSKSYFPGNWTPNITAALTHSPSTFAQHGKFALILSTWYSYVPGHLFYGDHKNPDGNNWTNYNVAFNGKPVKLTGYYRYTDPVNFNDTAMGQVILKNNSGDTLAYGEALFDTTANWTFFEIKLKYFSVTKTTSIAIHFSSCINCGGMNENNTPNRLYLDNLQLVYKKPD